VSTFDPAISIVFEYETTKLGAGFVGVFLTSVTYLGRRRSRVAPSPRFSINQSGQCESGSGIREATYCFSGYKTSFHRFLSWRQCVLLRKDTNRRKKTTTKCWNGPIVVNYPIDKSTHRICLWPLFI
jgi:hypothetical protein